MRLSFYHQAVTFHRAKTRFCVKLPVGERCRPSQVILPPQAFSLKPGDLCRPAVGHFETGVEQSLCTAHPLPGHSLSLKGVQQMGLL